MSNSRRNWQLAVFLFAVFLGGDRLASAADCNGNRIQDVEDIESGTSEDCNGNDIPDECDVGPIDFGSALTVHPVTRRPLVVEAGDVDGDGDLDLVAGSRLSGEGVPSTLAVLLNQGDGVFERQPDVPAVPQLVSMTLFDLEGDGDLDIAAANSTAIAVFVNLFNGSSVVFGPPSPRELKRTIRDVTYGDFNGDGFPDLVTVNTDPDSISLFTNEKDGTFGEPAALRFPTGSFPQSAAVADLDGDGDVDIVVSNRNSGTLAVLLNQGGGTFTAPVDYDNGAELPFAVLVDDFDGDGALDLASSTGSDVSLLSGDGQGRFAEPVTFNFPGKASAIAAVDLDGDGDVDIAATFTNRRKLSVFMNGGNGRFEVAVSLGAGDIPQSRSIVAADLDGDGDPDLASGSAESDAVTVLWNGEDGEDEDEHARLFEERATFPATRPHTAALGDFDGDGDLDIVTGNNHRRGVSVLSGHGDGTFERPVTHADSLVSFSIAPGDFDGDGDLDVASADQDSGQLQVLLNDGSASLTLGELHSVGSNPFHVTAADLDGDGALDLVTSNRGDNSVSLVWNRGDATFVLSQPVRVGNGPRSSAAVDLDGDGRPELAVASTNSSEVSVLKNIGDRTFAAPVSHALSGAPNFVVAGDLDLDGDQDLALVNGLFGRNVTVLWNSGAGTFDGLTEISAVHEPYSLLTADLDGDGRLDLATTNQSNSSLSILYNKGERAFYRAVNLRTGSGPRFALAGDLDGDLDIDLVSVDRVGDSVTVYLNGILTTVNLYRELICTEADFHSLSVASTTQGGARVTKYVLPARDDPELLPTLFQNASRFPLHQEFLAESFPERFANLTGEEYDQLVGRRLTRDYFVGALARVRTGMDFVYAFTVFADTGFGVSELLELDDVRYIHEKLSASFTLRPLLYQPDTDLARRKAESWVNPPFDVLFDDGAGGVEYEAYTSGVGYGRVRLLTLAELNEPANRGRFTFQDILVIDQAPRDIEGVVGGVITGERQGGLSHLAVRTARRGTPNAYVRDALEVFSAHDGNLIRIEVFETEYFLTDVAPEEAEEFWSSRRPQLDPLPKIDTDYAELDHLFDMDLTGTGARSPVWRFGGKAVNLARLQRLLSGEYAQYRESGFAIPMRYYVEFMRANTRIVGERELSYEEYLLELLATPEIQSDSQERFEALGEFRDFARENGVVDQDLVDRLVGRIEAVFGSTQRMVRFRSSSNVEDALVFNGAGLYESTSVCAADTLDPERLDGSHCDPSRDNERTIERALKKVWTSLWTFRAHEERAFFQVPPATVAMGVLVNRAFLDEVANGVAFTGNPRNSRDRRYVVTAQVGEESVVSPAPGISVERNLLEVAAGEVTRIFRDRSSSLVEPGEVVVSDEHLRELGALMWHVDQNFPLDLEGHAREEALLDFEFKVEPDGSLAVKQVRPFLLSEPALPSPTFELEIPPETVVCGVFSDERVGREPHVELATKSTVRFVPGRLDLPTASDTFAADLFEEVLFGPEALAAIPDGPGLFRIVRIADAGNQTIYRFSYEQRFGLPGGASFTIELFNLNFRGRGEIPIEGTKVFDEEFITFELSMQGSSMEEPLVSYSSCNYELLPEWQMDVEIDAGSRLSLRERFLPSENNFSTGPASLVHAEVVLDGARQVVTDYWRLVYAARRHNQDVRYWAVLDPALILARLGESPIRVVELAVPDGLPDAQTEPGSVHVRYLDENFEIIAEQSALDYRKLEVDEPLERSFRRGDVDTNGVVNVTDAIAFLSYFFQRGKELTCRKAADADDSGRLDVADGVNLLLYLFGGRGSLPAPIACAPDPTPDDLSCGSYGECQ